MQPRLLVPEATQISMCTQVVFKWLYLLWTISQLAVSDHITGW